MNEPLPFPESFLVFAQKEGVTLDLPRWQRHARDYFGTTVTAVTAGSGHRVSVEGGGLAAAASRGLHLAPRTPEDLAVAERVAAATGGGGLDLLAARCPFVWRIEAQGDDDRASLLLAAVIASVALGPILSPSRCSLFGVRTARERLEVGKGHR